MEDGQQTIPPVLRYYLVGADQQEYGPVTAAQLEQWIAEGRANGQTLVRLDGTNERKPLAQFAEFAPALVAKTKPLVPPLPSQTGQMHADPASVLANATASRPEVRISHCLSRAWTLLLSDFWPIVGYSAVVTLLIIAASHLYVGIVVNGPLLGGYLAYCLQRIRGQESGWETIFSGFSERFLGLFLTTLICVLLIGVGTALCVLPGIYLLVAWKFALWLVADKRLEFWDAMETSRKVVNECWWQVFGLVVLSYLIAIAGAMVLCVGGFVAGPLVILAFAYAYEDLFNRNPAAGH